MASVYHLLNRQIPAYIKEQYPVFCKFIEYYYRWLQTRGFDKLEKVTNIDYECIAITVQDCYDKQDNPVEPSEFAKTFVGFTIVNDQGVVAEIVGYDGDKILIRYLTQDAIFSFNDTIYVRNNTSKTIKENQKYNRANIGMLETLPSAYIDHFLYLLDNDHIFDRNSANVALILKHAKQLYQSKGSEQALKYILKATKDIDADIRYPWQQVFKPSDGKWKRQFAVNVAVSEETWTNFKSFDRDDEKTKVWYPIQTDFESVWVEVPQDKTDDKEPEYKEHTVVRVEVFSRQDETYDYSKDEEGNDVGNGWWKRAEHGSDINFTPITQKDPNTHEYGDGNGTFIQDVGFDWEKLSRVMQNLRDTYGEEKFEEFPFTRIVPSGDTPDEAKEAWNMWAAEELSYPVTYGHYGIKNLEKVVESLVKGEAAKLEPRSITPYIRIYFEDNPHVTVGQNIQVRIPQEDGTYKIELAGKVASGVRGFDIQDGGKMWQVGQIFTASKDSIFRLYDNDNPPLHQTKLIRDEYTGEVSEQVIPNSISTNKYGVVVQYSTDVPLIGRVTSVSDTGAILSAEIVQLGDHVPYMSDKILEVSPLFVATVDPSEYKAQIKLEYGPQTNVLGYFDDNCGMISDNSIRLHDNYYYQKFSYDIVANADPATYVDLAEKMHPAGAKMFTTYMMEADLDCSDEINAGSSATAVRVSLFDIAIATDKLAKKIIKPFKDEVVVRDLVTMMPIKNLRDNVSISDHVHDRVYTFARDYSYVDPAEKYFERVFDNHVNNGYCDTGSLRFMFFNYEYQTIPEQYKSLEE